LIRKLWRIAVELEAEPEPTAGSGLHQCRREAASGTARVRVITAFYGPTDSNRIRSDRTDRPTIVNLTNHQFFNLDGRALRNDILGTACK